MKNVSLYSISFIAILLTACSNSGSEKKIIIMANGNLTVTGNTIKVEPSLTHHEQEVVLKGDKVALNVESTDGIKKTFDLTENGIYLLNLQKDTLIGGLVNYGQSGMPSLITADQLDHIIDSTQKMMAGLNASDEKKTFFLPPFSIKKISSQSSARLIGPFKGIPYKVDVDNTGKTVEVIKFYTNKQKRETLQDLMAERAKIKNIR